MNEDVKCIIGLEIHAQMKTKSKIFCSCPNSNKDALPNTTVCPICLGYPGTKPALNKKVFENGIKIAKALNCKISKNIFFSRKSYFYPDMSKNYQVTQYEIPVGLKGYLNINFKGKDIKINITRAHIEEDPGKLIHVGGDITNSKYVLVDYNRAGTPLIEIVTEPDFTHPEQVREFLTKLKAILEHLDIYSPELVMKADANISVKGGARVEVKNISGVHNIINALNYEYNRQRIMAKQGIFIKSQETRAYNEKAKTTKKLRVKETEADYGYIFEPDLSWQLMTKNRLNKIFLDMNELPDERIKRFRKQYGLTKYVSEIIIITDKNLADFYEESAKLVKNKKLLANWIITELLKCLNYNKVMIKQSKIKPKIFAEFINSLDSKKISTRFAKELIKDLVSSGRSLKELIKNKELKINDDKIIKIIDEIFKKNKNIKKEYNNGKKEIVNYFIGQVLRKTNFQANVDKIRTILLKKLRD